ncbi:hypothetical protein, partial [Nesterenkonia sp. PF2B19]|uniref:hypothetical protein n=1 Tax=Nesterenkonia sp. PF2B19 TaxID=1881858 RepID=UPI000A22FC5F
MPTSSAPHDAESTAAESTAAESTAATAEQPNPEQPAAEQPADEPVAGSTSWSTSLEGWARARHGGSVLTVPSTLDFAPLGTLRPQTFYELPVVLAVMTRRTAPLHVALTRAVEVIREATYAFRAVVVTDVPTSAPIRTVDWTVEHVLGEADWAVLQEENWLPAAVDQLEWARRQYGASLVLAPETPEQVLEDVARVGAFTRAPEKILDTAAGLVREALPASEPPPGHPPSRSCRAGGTPPVLTGWCGGWPSAAASPL